MNEAYVYKSNTTTTTTEPRDNSGLIVGVGLVILAFIVGGLFLFFNYSENARQIDRVNAQTEAQIRAAETQAQIDAARAANQQEPLVIDRPVMVPIEKPVVVEKEVIREVPAPAPTTDTAQ